MHYNKIMIGKIRKIDYKSGTGEILTVDNEFMFLTKDIKGNEELQTGDVVKFRGENINGINRAFFVKKENITEQL